MEDYINFALMYILSDHVLPVLPLKDLINKDGKPTMPYKLATGMKPSILHLHYLFFPCVVCKATAHVGTKALNMCHEAQKGFRGIFVGIPHNQKGYLVCVPHKWKIVSSYNVIFDEIFSSALVYTSQPYTEAMGMHLAVSYMPYATYSKEQTGNIISFAQFEEGGLLSETYNDMEIGNESDDN